MAYAILGAPDHATSAAEQNYVRATRDNAAGWSGRSLSPPLQAPTTSYLSLASSGLAADLQSTFVQSDQPLSGPVVPSGQNAFLRRPDGSYKLLTLVGSPFDPILKTYNYTSLEAGNADYSHVYIQPYRRQVPSDPVTSRNTYAWSLDRGTRLIGILPDGTPAPNGASLAYYGLQGFSADGKYVAFTADGRLYLRIDDAQTVEIGASHRTVDPDPNTPTYSAVGLTVAGDKVLFTSPAELTNDANTGRSGGIATDAGRDLYSYDTATGDLTDLTADHDPADAATGANVQLAGLTNHPIVGATPDGSYIYFVATGKLADGATSGQSSLYVWHDDRIDFVARADNMIVSDARLPFSIAASGRHIVFASTDRLTGYDNTDPITQQPHAQVFKATLGRGLECVSCRPNGSRPTGGSSIPLATLGPIRVISDDGRRVFFHSTDAIVPQASSGFQVVFQHADGKVSAISPVDGPPAAGAGRLATFLDASASGDDVFFETYGTLVPNANGGDDAVYDARVGGGFPAITSQRCSGAACQASPTPAPLLPQTDGVVVFPDEDNVTDTSATPERAKVAVSKVRTIIGTTVTLKVKISGPGRLNISGSGLRSTHTNSSKAATVTVRVALTRRAATVLAKRGSFKATATVRLVLRRGRTSTATVALTFRSRSASEKGAKS